MATATKPKPAAPPEQPAPSASNLLDEALTAAESELQALRQQRAAALRGVLADPIKAGTQVAGLDGKINDAERHLQALNDAAEQIAIETEAAEKLAAQAACVKDRETLVKIARERVALAAEIDAAVGAVVKAILCYKENGRACAALSRSVIGVLYPSDVEVQINAAVCVMPRASGISADAAAALAVTVIRMAAALDAPDLERFIEINSFSPRSGTFAEASKNDAETLAARFGGGV